MEPDVSETRDRDQRPQVLVSVTNTGWIHKHVTRAILRIVADQRYRVTYIDPTHKPYEDAMNRISLDMLNGPWDWWLNIDSDNPPLRNPLDLIELDRDICGLPTPIYHNTGDGKWPICWNALDIAKGEDGYREHKEQQGLQQVDVIGSGCMLVHRRVIDGVKPPWFVRETDEYGRVIHGPDFYFCRKATAAGFQVWANYDYRCRHFNEVELVEAMHAFQRADSPVSA